MQAYTIKQESGYILECDLGEAAGKMAHSTETDAGLVELGVRADHVRREIIASVSLQDAGDLELAIQLPPAWPLQDPKLECRKLVRPCNHCRTLQLTILHRRCSRSEAWSR